MNGRSIVWVSLAMAVVLAAVSALKYDFVTVAVAVIYAVVLLYPLRRDGRVYHNAVSLTALVGLIVLTVLNVLGLLGMFSDMYYANVPWMWVLELLCVPLVTFPMGFMLGSMFEVYGGSYISKRWLIVFGIAFAMAVSGVYIFTVGFDLWYTGQPFFNQYTSEHVEHLPPEIVLSNRTQMAAGTCATASVIVIAFVFRYMTKKKTLQELCGGDFE